MDIEDYSTKGTNQCKHDEKLNEQRCGSMEKKCLNNKVEQQATSTAIRSIWGSTAARKGPQKWLKSMPSGKRSKTVAQNLSPLLRMLRPPSLLMASASVAVLTCTLTKRFAQRWPPRVTDGILKKPMTVCA